MMQERLDHFIGLLFAFKMENMEELNSPSSHRYTLRNIKAKKGTIKR